MRRKGECHVVTSASARASRSRNSFESSRPLKCSHSPTSSSRARTCAGKKCGNSASLVSTSMRGRASGLTTSDIANVHLRLRVATFRPLFFQESAHRGGEVGQGDFRLLYLRMPVLLELEADVAAVAYTAERGDDLAERDEAAAREHGRPVLLPHRPRV